MKGTDMITFHQDGRDYPRWTSNQHILTDEEILKHPMLGEEFYKLHKEWINTTCPGKDGQRFGKDDLVVGGAENPIKEELLPIRKWIPAERNYDNGFSVAPKGHYFTPRGFSTSPIYREDSVWKILDVSDLMVIVKKLGTRRIFWSGGIDGAELENYTLPAKEETALSREEFTKNWSRVPADLEHYFIEKKKKDIAALPYKVYDYQGKQRMSVQRNGKWIDLGIIESEVDLRDKKAHPEKYCSGQVWGKEEKEQEKDSRFPWNWIKPGEFRYCQCGRWMIPLVALKCGACSVKWTEQREIGHLRPEQREWQQTHLALMKQRNDLAAKRRAEGMPPLFWVKDSRPQEKVG